MKKVVEMTFQRANIRVTNDTQPYRLMIYYELPFPNSEGPFVVTESFFDMPELLKRLDKMSKKESW